MITSPFHFVPLHRKIAIFRQQNADLGICFLQVDTTNILFVCGGAFTGLEKIISARGRSSSIGFSAKVIEQDDRGTGEILRKVEPGDRRSRLPFDRSCVAGLRGFELANFESQHLSSHGAQP